MKTITLNNRVATVINGPAIRFDRDGIEKVLDYDDFILNNSGPADVGDAVTYNGLSAILIRAPKVKFDLDAIELIYEPTLIQSYNVVPVASGVTFTGTLQDGQVLTGAYTFTDPEGDAEGASTFQWSSDTDGAGTGKAVIGGATSATYTLVVGDVAKHIYFEVTPVSATGATPGIAVESASQGPVIA